MDAVQRMINRLEAGAATFECSGCLSSLEPVTRTAIYTRLLYERLARKHQFILDIYTNEGQYWEQIFYVMLLRFLGAPTNTEPFEKLARRVTYPTVSRHIDSPEKLEALFIGTSGLLDLYPNDEYTQNMRVQWDYLAQKFGIQPMSAGEWKIAGIYPHNNPVLRMSQAAAVLSQPGFCFERILACRNSEDAARLLSHEASEYWSTHFIPSVPSPQLCKRIGRDKVDILTINVIAPLQFSFGCYIDNDTLRDRALNLLDTIHPENNFKVRRWTNGGLIPKSAFDTQVLIHLGDEYCLKKRCRECPVGRRMIKTLKETCKLEENK